MIETARGSGLTTTHRTQPGATKQVDELNTITTFKLLSFSCSVHVLCVCV